jgi:4-hydroxybenzoate polyprenyltransferase
MDVVTRASLTSCAEAAGRFRTARALWKQLRVQQWAKNLLVFVPVVCAHRFGEAEPWLGAAGAAAGLLAVLVFALYIQHPTVALLSRHPGWLWLLCPLWTYWIGRLWPLAHRGELSGDPLAFVLRDEAGYAVAAARGALFALAL